MNTTSITATSTARPQCDPSWVVGLCPQCGGPVVVNDYYAGGAGYRTYRECWASLGMRPTCGYRVRLTASLMHEEALRGAVARIEAGCVAVVRGDFMNFYEGGRLVGIVDRLALMPDPRHTATPSASFLPDVPAEAFEAAALRRMERNAQERSAARAEDPFGGEVVIWAMEEAA